MSIQYVIICTAHKNTYFNTSFDKKQIIDIMELYRIFIQDFIGGGVIFAESAGLSN